MTIQFPRPNFADKLLNLMGKKRGVYLPQQGYTENGPYFYIICKKENFLKALFRPVGQKLPSDMVDINTLPGKEFEAK